MDFFSRHSILISSQYGFRPNHSTELAVHHLSQNMYYTMDNKWFQITCDFSKAFDMIFHTISLDKLYHYGIRRNPNNWLQSYLTNIKQYTTHDNSSSPYSTIIRGVPQGSFLGPLLFFLFILMIYIVHSSNRLISNK